MKGRYKKHSDLLQLLNSRKSWELKGEYLVPVQDKRLIIAAASAYGVANNSDPWATLRMRLYLERGFEFASDVLKEANATITRRSHEGVGAIQRRGLEPTNGFSGLSRIKRKLDEDRAWNQYRSAQYAERKEAA